MKRKSITSRGSSTFIDLDSFCDDPFEEPSKRKVRKRDFESLGNPYLGLFYLVLKNYIESHSKELSYFPEPKNPLDYGLKIIRKDGSEEELEAPPPFFFERTLKGLKEWKLMDYNPYSDKVQTSILNARYKGKDNLVELCVRPTQYGREIVFRKPGKRKSLKEAG